MADPEIRAKILAIKDLYTLPQTLCEVLRICDDPETSAYDISRIILHDPPITARLLRMANSAIYGRSGSVKTVHDAVVMLGFRSVKSLVLSTAVYDVFNNRDENVHIDLSRFWQHALETAGIAQLLASRIGFQSQEEAFVAGLMHDLGILLMARAFGSDYGTLVDNMDGAEELCALEQGQFGIDHAEAAEILLKEWGLPDQLVAVVGKHHDTLMGATGPAVDKLTLLVALADHLGHQGIEARQALSRAQVEEKHRVMAALGLQPIDLISVDRWMSENLSELASYLDIKIGSPTEILTRANQRLYELYSEMETLLLNSPSSKRDQFAREIMDAICATYSHHINNATTTIMGHSELVEMAVRKGLYSDTEGRLVKSMRMIERSVCTITAVLHEMKTLREFDVVSYHDRAKILDIDAKLKRRLETMLPS